MDKLPQNYVFNFVPHQLIQVTRRIEKKYKGTGTVAASLMNRLPELLAEIRLAPVDAIGQLIQDWPDRYVRLLIRQWPYDEESEQVQHKINLILSSRFQPIFGIEAWSRFQEQPSHRFVQDLLVLIYPNDRMFSSHGSLEHEEQSVFNEAFRHPNGLLPGLVSGLIHSHATLQEMLKALKVKEGSELDRCLNFDVLQTGLSIKSFVKREGAAFLRSKLERYILSDYQLLMKGYLEAREYQEFDKILLDQAVQRLHDPRERQAEWAFLDEQAMRQVEKWLSAQELDIIFEHDGKRRAEYWRTYMKYIELVVRLKNRNEPMAAFIYFENFVVLEFGEVGRAYFYHREGFEKWIQILTSTPNYRFAGSQAKTFMLKEMSEMMHGEPLFIERLGHGGYYESWTAKFNRHIHAYLRGEYSYKE
ncbi:EH signature domain-containing protein [Paenibacillus sp. FSL W8-1187]|uniref:Uncharacterized protein n=1 Tax=Paenibacillus pasadenensis TaxID=217090 RepID=A0A2N5N0S3_9BACL|nr:EH signature domain-containing protein [Paenibacillus pasadenensis]PLT43937.1 hypothetical protein B8V81_2368 [Paenibacillus pasadenensis]